MSAPIPHGLRARIPEDVRRALAAQGWHVEQTRGNHIRMVPPDPRLPACVTGGTPSDPRAWRNARAALRRCGLALGRAQEQERSTQGGGVGR